MKFTSEFVPLPLDQLRREAAVMKADGWRFMQTHAVNGEDGVDLYYSFMKDGHARNYRVEGVAKGTPVPSITDIFLAAFVFENEARELFGVDMRDIAIDFHGAMYAPAQSEPMTFITPEQKAAKEKAAKVAAAKAAKAAAAANGAGADGGEAPAKATGATAGASAGKRVFTMTPELQARLDAKYPTLSDEKKAKVDAALKARAEEAAAAQSGGGAAGDAAPSAPTSPSSVPVDAPAGEDGTPGASATAAKADGQAVHQPTATEVAAAKADEDRALADALTLMDPEKAAKVRAALAGEAPVTGAEDVQAAGAAPGAGSESFGDDAQVAQLLNMMDDAKAARVAAALSGKGGN